jgi:hypothetical protein
MSQPFVILVVVFALTVLADSMCIALTVLTEMGIAVTAVTTTLLTVIQLMLFLPSLILHHYACLQIMQCRRHALRAI